MPLCYHCFREKANEGPCPFCGYDGAEQAGRYPRALRPGTILNGRYIVGRVLGQGGFGITYLAQDYQSKERVAIKEYFPTEFVARATDATTVFLDSNNRREDFDYGKTQFLEEARTLAAFLGNVNIVRIYSYFEENGTAYFSMEYVDGLPLDKYMAAKGGRLTPDEANRLLLPLMEALEQVHAKGIVHRDIAPDNILIDKNGKAKLIDFGAARYSTGEKSKSLDVVLKHGFAPKEQYMRRGRQGPWTDVYALAATYYYTITGRVPPEAIERIDEDNLIPPSSLGVKLNAAQEDVLFKALAVSAADRYQNMGEFRVALLQASGGSLSRSVPAFETGSAHGAATEIPRAAPAPARNPSRKKSKVPLLIAAAMVLAAVIFGASRLAGSKSEAPAVTPVVTEGPTAKPAATPTTASTPKPAASAVPSAAAPTSAPVTKEMGNWSWTLQAGVLTIRGEGAMSDLWWNDLPWENYTSEIRQVVVEEGITRIGNYAFDSLSIELLENPASVDSIGSAFTGCNGLKRIEVAEGNRSFRQVDGVLYSYDGKTIICFPAGRSESFYRIPDGVTTIGSAAFCASGIKDVEIPESVTSIESSAFASCRYLGAITLPEKLTSIGGSAFYNCICLESVSIPSPVTAIPYQAFGSCKNLKSIIIPAGVTQIGNNAFNGCTALKDVYYAGTSAQWGKITVGENNEAFKSATIHTEA